MWNIDTPEGMRLAKEWTLAHISYIRDGGMWVVPRSLTVLKIEHSKQTVTCVAQGVPDTAIRKVFEALGWTWIDNDDQTTTLAE